MEKNKKDKKTNVLLGISVAVNIILAIVFLAVGAKAVDELKFSYVEVDTITPDTIRSNLERENYGVAACLSHPIRGGAKVADEDLDYYMLGEYADLLFLKEIFAEAGNTETLNSCEERLAQIRSEMSDYGSLFDKIDHSAENSRAE